MRHNKFSIKDNLMIFMLLVLFSFRFIPQKIQVIIMVISVIIAVYFALKLKTKNYSIEYILVFILFAISMFILLIEDLIKIKFNQFIVYEPYLMILLGLLFSSVAIIIFIVIFKSGDKEKIKKLILPSICLIVVASLYFYFWIDVIIKG